MKIQNGRRRERRERPARKKVYLSPRLTTYGTVAKLTMAAAGSVGDAGSMMRNMVCL